MVTVVGYFTVFFPKLANPVAGASVAVGLLWLLTFINLGGIGVFSVVQNVFTVLKLIPLAADRDLRLVLLQRRQFRGAGLWPNMPEIVVAGRGFDPVGPDHVVVRRAWNRPPSRPAR